MFPDVTDFLTEFILARIAEDEAQADRVFLDYGTGDWDSLKDRVLVECAAKRRIVEVHAGTPYFELRYPGYIVCVRCGNPDTGEGADVEWPCDTVRAIASVYADHPDYRQEWAL
jgi:hypothetical protein